MGRILVPLLVAVLLGCGGGPPQEGRARTAGGAAPRESEPASAPPSFAADSAWAYLARQVAFGPRVPGSAAHRSCAQWLAARLAAAGGSVRPDTFTYVDPEGTRWPLENILARFGPDGPGRLLLVAHWDTRPWSDRDPVPERRDIPIPGANDGGSGVAVLLEVARHLGAAPLPRGVDILLTDGEDLGRTEDPEGYCRGARRFAARGVGQYRRAVVVDMVGDADLRLPVEATSQERAPGVVDWVWGRGVRISPDVFDLVPGPTVYDDHVPLLDAGLPAVDVIDMEYPAWHTAADDLHAVSRTSLARVGAVLLSLARDP